MVCQSSQTCYGNMAPIHYGAKLMAEQADGKEESYEGGVRGNLILEGYDAFDVIRRLV